MRKTITVTQKDIDEGTPTSVYRCPIARAAARAFKVAGDSYIVVGIFNLSLKRRVPPFETEMIWAAPLPPRAKEFMGQFDGVVLGEVKPQPFRFSVTVPDTKVPE